MALLDWKDKDWSKVVITDEILEYVIDKYERDRKENDEIIDIMLQDLWQKAYNELEVTKDTDEEQPQVASTSRRYRKISMTGCVLFLRACNAPTPVDQYVNKPKKGKVKVTNRVLALKVVNALDVDVGSSSTSRKSI
ncbi:hypothetical protein Tco_0990351 [Tanacetum coccineum]|uniref:Uncharacterized protein n=1 Tax=Tanacetum coccineum TaxID=301880 RepID=A0ABQ5EXL2_9ASTR